VPQITTTHGLVEESALARTVGFEDRPNEFVVWVEWRLDDELVRRDAHVILKRPGADAQAVLGAIASPNDVTVGLSGVAAEGAAGGFE
jgi:hypothetical protein